MLLHCILQLLEVDLTPHLTAHVITNVIVLSRICGWTLVQLHYCVLVWRSTSALYIFLRNFIISTIMDGN